MTVRSSYSALCDDVDDSDAGIYVCLSTSSCCVLQPTEMAQDSQINHASVNQSINQLNILK